MGDERPDHIIDAEKNPRDYFTCCLCGDGPWHKAWATETSWESHQHHGVGLLGACCSGAD